MAVERLLKDEATEEKGDRARLASFVGAMAIADLAKTTLGSKGMGKCRGGVSNLGPLLQLQRLLPLGQPPTSKIFLFKLIRKKKSLSLVPNISKVQDNEAGEGMTSVVVLAGELLRRSRKNSQSKNSSDGDSCRAARTWSLSILLRRLEVPLKIHF